MKRKFILILLLIIYSHGFGQEVHHQGGLIINKNTTAFLLGMLDDSNAGKSFIPCDTNLRNRVNTFYTFSELENTIGQIFIDSLALNFRTESYDLRIEKTTQDYFLWVYSDVYTNLFRPYFIYEYNPHSFLSSGGDQLYDMFVGEFNAELLQSKEEKLYFILGYFLRYGKISKNEEYELRDKYNLPENKNSNYNIVKGFLIETASVVKEEVFNDKNYHQILKFEPSKELMALIEEFKFKFPEK